MAQFLTNAFSLQMVHLSNYTLHVTEVQPEEIPTTVASCVGHEDTARVLSDMLGFEVPQQRINLCLGTKDELFVAQLQGGRLPEGATTLPDGFTFRFFRITVTA